MWFNETVELGSVAQTVTSGEPISTITWRTVFADKKSVGGKEFYEGNNIGIKPELRFVIRTGDYSGEDLVRHNSVQYTVARKYADGDFTELTVTSVVG